MFPTLFPYLGPNITLVVKLYRLDLRSGDPGRRHVRGFGWTEAQEEGAALPMLSCSRSCGEGSRLFMFVSSFSPPQAWRGGYDNNFLRLTSSVIQPHVELDILPKYMLLSVCPLGALAHEKDEKDPGSLPEAIIGTSGRHRRTSVCNLCFS